MRKRDKSSKSGSKSKKPSRESTKIGKDMKCAEKNKKECKKSVGCDWDGITCIINITSRNATCTDRTEKECMKMKFCHWDDSACNESNADMVFLNENIGHAKSHVQNIQNIETNSGSLVSGVTLMFSIVFALVWHWN